MKTIEYTTIDKSSWGNGPWDAEPDKVQWQDEATGLPCIAKRADGSGHWCGYVGVDEKHPLFKLHYDAAYERAEQLDGTLDVHGGLTFSSHCQHGAEEHSVCHIPDAGEPDNVWWLGFDCAHAFDMCPGYNAIGIMKSPTNVYRDLNYIKSECANLAAQLKVMSHSK